LAAACGSAPGAEPKTVAEEPAVETPQAADPEASAGPADEPAASADSGAAAAPEESSAAPEGQRQVIYRMTSGGLQVEVDGVKIEPKAVPIQKKGGWGVRVTMKVTSTDGKMHRLLSPENGPLAFAATVKKHGKEIARHPDERKGEEEQFVPPDDSLDVTREFPGDKEAPLWGGQELTLQVGLWGLGVEADQRKPVRKLFVVKMVTGNAKPQPMILPPE
jgi:hypothetical protein